jgi:hypothetical protein
MVLHAAIVASIASEEFTSITDNAIAIQSGTVLSYCFSLKTMKT